MSNKTSPHQHGLHTTNITRPKSKLRVRANKAKARVRRDERFTRLEQGYNEALKAL